MLDVLGVVDVVLTVTTEPTADEKFAQEQLDSARAEVEYWERYLGLRE